MSEQPQITGWKSARLHRLKPKTCLHVVDADCVYTTVGSMQGLRAEAEGVDYRYGLKGSSINCRVTDM